MNRRLIALGAINADGSLAERAEFDNHLTSSGSYVLAALLQGQAKLRLDGDQRGLEAIFGDQEGNRARIYPNEFAGQGDLTGGFPTLTVGLVNINAQYFIELDGSAIAVNEGVLTQVSSWPYTCGLNTPCENPRTEGYRSQKRQSQTRRLPCTRTALRCPMVFACNRDKQPR